MHKFIETGEHHLLENTSPVQYELVELLRWQELAFACDSPEAHRAYGWRRVPEAPSFLGSSEAQLKHAPLRKILLRLE